MLGLLDNWMRLEPHHIEGIASVFRMGLAEGLEQHAGMPKASEVVPADIVARIVNVRGQRVLLDSDLATVYGVTTARLNQQVNPNLGRFPSDFIFQLSDQLRL